MTVPPTNPRHHLLAAHSILPFLLFTLVGAFALTGWLPPPSPSLSKADTALLFRDDLMMRIGVSIIVMGSPLYMGLSCAMYFQLRRMEGAAPVLSTLQMISSAMTVLTVMVPGYLWLAISYNPDTPAEVTVMVNNLAFFILIADVWPVILRRSASPCASSARETAASACTHGGSDTPTSRSSSP